MHRKLRGLSQPAIALVGIQLQRNEGASRIGNPYCRNSSTTDIDMPRMMFVVMLLCEAGAAHAQTLYHCRAHGVSSYQQSPCPSSSRTVSSIETNPEPAPTESQRRAQVAQAEQDRAESAFLSHSAGTDSRPANNRSAVRRTSWRSPQRSACQEARAARSASLKAVGLNRTYDMLRNLDESVTEACKRS
jgi:hypothetical protein